jgi:hypothetical protein
MRGRLVLGLWRPRGPQCYLGLGHFLPGQVIVISWISCVRNLLCLCECILHVYMHMFTGQQNDLRKIECSFIKK